MSIKLSSADNKEFTADREAMSISNLLQSVIEDAGAEEVVPLPNISSKVLEKVIAYCEHHKGNLPQNIARPLKSNKLEEYVTKYDNDFVSVPQEELFAYLLAANYLDIKPLMDLCCAKIATMIKGKTPNEIRQLFGIENDFTPEEEAQVLQEQRWVEGV